MQKVSTFAVSKQEIVRGGAVVARWAHNPKVGGSIPSPATEMDKSVGLSFFIALNPPVTNNLKIFLYILKQLSTIFLLLYQKIIVLLHIERKQLL